MPDPRKRRLVEKTHQPTPLVHSLVWHLVTRTILFFTTMGLIDATNGSSRRSLSDTCSRSRVLISTSPLSSASTQVFTSHALLSLISQLQPTTLEDPYGDRWSTGDLLLSFLDCV